MCLPWTITFAAEVVLTGTVTDAATGRPIVGAEISINSQDGAIGSARSNDSGRFKVTVTVRDTGLQSLKVIAEDPEYKPADRDAETLNGNLQQPGYNFSLLPASLANCISGGDEIRNLVVVGHFAAPPGEVISDLSWRLSQALQESLDLELQITRAPTPEFVDCDGAEVRRVKDGRGIARALNAHALLYGTVSNQPSKYHVKARVIDAHDPSGSALRTTSPAVDLANPDEATMHPDLYVAVLSSMAAGLLKDNDCAGALSIANAADRLVDPTPDFVGTVEQRCELPE